VKLSWLILLLGMGASACQVPVFRYALERWTADAYDVVLVSHRELSPAEQAVEGQLREAQQRCNLVLHSEREARWQAAFDRVKPDDPPQLLLFYPGRPSAPFWEGELSAENVDRIIDSPLRRQIAEDLLAGISTVWVQIDSGDAEADDSASTALSQHLAVAAERTKIPGGVLPIDHGPDQGPIDLDDVLRSSIPLQIAFTTYRVSRRDAEESVFVAMLQQLSPSLIGLGQPIAVPIFGRGRGLEGIPAEALSKDSIAAATGYLCAACSCQVKSENPGLDLLMAVDWDAQMLGNLIIEDKSLPPLSGFAEGSHVAPASPAAPSADPWRPPLLGTILLICLVVAGATVYVLRSQQRK
jgi:hypothetical protein